LHYHETILVLFYYTNHIYFVLPTIVGNGSVENMLFNIW